MAVTVSVYHLYKQKLLNQVDAIDLDDAGTTLKVALLSSSYTPDLAAHEFFDDLTNEITGTGYTAGGEALTTKTVGLDGSGFAYFDADDTVWATATFTARYGVLYKDTGTPGTSPLILLIDFGADRSPAGVDFRLIWAAAASGAILQVA